jgi:hypothetical protein
MTERELVAEVTNLCDQLGLLWHHCRDTRPCRGPRGLPDLIITGPRGVIFAELKSEDGATSPDQDLWLWTLRKGGATIELWRPADLESGIVRALLEQLA